MARVFGYRCLQVECFKRNVAPRTIEADIFEISVCEPVVHSQRGWSHSSVPAGRRKFYGFAGDNIVHDESIPYRWPLRNFDLPLNLQNASSSAIPILYIIPHHTRSQPSPAVFLRQISLPCQANEQPVTGISNLLPLSFDVFILHFFGFEFYLVISPYSHHVWS